jgi:hypothetical protein
MNWSNADCENQTPTAANPMTADQITVILAERVTGRSVVPGRFAPKEPLVARSTGLCGGAGVILGRERQVFSETTRSDRKLAQGNRMSSKTFTSRDGRGGNADE